MTVHRSGARKSGLLGGPRPLTGLSVTIGCPASEVPTSSAALLGWRHPLDANHRGKWAGDTTSAFGLPTSSAVGQFHHCPLCRFSEFFCRPTKRPRENLPGCMAPAELCQLPRWVRHVTWEPMLGDRNDYVPAAICIGIHYLKFETRSACSRMTLALSVAAVPVGSPLYMILGFDQKGMRGQPPQPCP